MRWFQRTTITEASTGSARGTHKRQTIRDLHADLKKQGFGARGDVRMFEQLSPGGEISNTLIHQAEVSKRGRVRVLEL